MTVNKLYVGNLNYQTTEETLREAFSAYGNVLSVKILPGRGFGFVEMETVEEAQKAREALNGQELDGRNLRVEEARPPREKKGFSKRRRY